MTSANMTGANRGRRSIVLIVNSRPTPTNEAFQ
jgi:hypothetical protein